MITLGIIGAENSHSHRIATLCNVEKRIPMRVTHLWGETTRLASELARKAEIPHVVKHWSKLSGQVDGVMINHRDGKHHFEPAKYFLQNSVPTFVDKPLTTSVHEAQELLKIASKKRTPLTSFSSVVTESSFHAFRKRVRKAGAIHVINSSGPADLESRYGGIFFYGIHQVEALIELLGIEVVRVSAQRCNQKAAAILSFRSGQIATCNFLPMGSPFHWSACTDRGVFNSQLKTDRIPYLSVAKLLLKLIRDGEEPFSPARLLAPVAVLEALAASLATK